MNADVRSKLEMAEHVRVFNRAHPATDIGTQPVFAQFDESIARANALITEQAQGNQRSRTANASRRELRKLLGVGLLRVDRERVSRRRAGGCVARDLEAPGETGAQPGLHRGSGGVGDRGPGPARRLEQARLVG